MIELNFDERYGKLLNYILIDAEDDRPTLVALIDHNDVLKLDIRYMYWTKAKPGKPRRLMFGKGCRLEIDNGLAEDVILAATALLAEATDLFESE